MKRFSGLALLKVLLMIQVVFFHALDQMTVIHPLLSLLKMGTPPLFFFLSGFLLKKQALQHSTPKNLFRKYILQLGLPWLGAFLLHSVLLYWKDLIRFPISGTINETHFLDIYEHLWFIPALLAMMAVLWAFEQFKVPAWMVLVCSGVATTIYFFALPGIEYHWQEDNLLFTTIGEERILSHFFFFFLSYYCRNYQPAILHQLTKPTTLWVSFSAVFLTTLLWDKAATLPEYGQVPFRIIACIIPIHLLFTLLTQIKIPRQVIHLCDRQAIPIYLYHYALLEGLQRHLPFIFPNLVGKQLLLGALCIVLISLAIMIMTRLSPKRLSLIGVQVNEL